MRLSCHKHKCVVSRGWMSHVTQMQVEMARMAKHVALAVRMRHVTRINQSYYTWVMNLYVCRWRRSTRESTTLLQSEWIMSPVWVNPVTHMNYEDNCLQVEKEHEWVMSHIWMRHVTHVNEPCHTYEWVMSHMWMSHVTHMNESCHTYESMMLHIWIMKLHVWRWRRSTRQSATL